MAYGTLGIRAFRLIHPDPDRSARASSHWSGQGRNLVTEPSLYLVTMVTPESTVRAVAASVTVSEPLTAAGLLPHEAVDDRLVARRLRALRRARVDREPVLLTHSGGGLAVSAATRSPIPLIEVTRGEMTVTVQQIAPSDAELVAADLARRTVLVADGHHRLAAAAAHTSTCSAGVTTAEDTECRRVTALLVDSDDTPLTLQPIHRVVHRRGQVPLRAPDVVTALAGNQPIPASYPIGLPGHIESAGPWDAQRRDPIDRTTAPPKVAASTTQPHRVVVLDRHGRIEIDCLPRTDDALPTTAHVVEAALLSMAATDVRRTPDADSLEQAITRRSSVGIVMPPVSRTDILDTIAAGLLMPIKATSFRPKLPAGILVRPLPEHW